jgi:6,7-dimethyl-8-ribityllumazine synthase
MLGGGSFQIGHHEPEKAAAKPAAAAAPAATTTPGNSSYFPFFEKFNCLTPFIVVAEPVVEKVKRDISGRVAIVVAGQYETEALSAAIVKALYCAGVSSVTVSKVDQLNALPYAAQNVSKSVDVVIAAAFIADDKGVSGALTSSLLQLGLAGRTPIIPALSCHESLLEAKALLSTEAEAWAEAAVNILDLKHDGNLEAVPAAAPEIKEKPVLTPEVNSAETLIEIFRESLKTKGARGIVGIGRKFRIVDDNKNGQIELGEFTKATHEHALGWSPDQIKTVFNAFDSDRSGGISYEEFLICVRGPMNERRKNIVLQAFQVSLCLILFYCTSLIIILLFFLFSKQILDTDKSGIVELDDIQGKYDASKHPDVIAGKRSADSVLRFVD